MYWNDSVVAAYINALAADEESCKPSVQVIKCNLSVVFCSSLVHVLHLAYHISY